MSSYREFLINIQRSTITTDEISQNIVMPNVNNNIHMVYFNIYVNNVLEFRARKFKIDADSSGTDGIQVFAGGTGITTANDACIPCKIYAR